MRPRLPHRRSDQALTIKDLLDFRDAEMQAVIAKEDEPRADCWVTVERVRTVAEAYQEMNEKDARLGIVVDDDGKPTGYITTGDVRRLLSGELP